MYPSPICGFFFPIFVIFWEAVVLDWVSVVSLALICSFTRMRNHLGLGNVKPEEVPEETVQAVAATLRKSAALKVSEDGECLIMLILGACGSLSFIFYFYGKGF